MSKPPRRRKALAERVGIKAERHKRARARMKRSVWFGFGMFGMVGWSVAVPTVLGTTLGIWLDRRWPGPPSWTLTLLFVGVVLGCVNAWYWMERERRINDDE